MKRSLTFLAICLAFPAFVSGRTLAISYFDNTSQVPQYNALSKGIADMLITDLSHIDGITIVEREKLDKLIGEIKLNQSKYFDQATAQKLGKGLGAQAVLTGAFMVLANQLRIDARLIDVQSGVIITAQEVTGDKSNFFALHKQLVALLGQGLKISVHPDKSSFIPKSNVSLTAVLDYSQAIDFSDRGMGEQAKALLEKTVTAYPDFTIAKSKLEELKLFLRKAEETRASLLEKEVTDLIGGLKMDDEQLGMKINQIWSSLLSGFQYTRLLGFNISLRNKGINDDFKLYGEMSPLTFGELSLYYDITAYGALKMHDKVLASGKSFIEKYPASMYFTGVKMAMDQSITELETREKGAKALAQSLPAAMVDVAFDIIDRSDNSDNLIWMNEKDYRKLKDYYEASILAAGRETILQTESWDKADDFTGFYDIARSKLDTDMMRQIAAAAVPVFSGSDEEGDINDLQDKIEKDIARIRKDSKKASELRTSLKNETDAPLSQLLKRYYSLKKYHLEKDLEKAARGFIKSPYAKAAPHAGDRKYAFEALISSLYWQGKFDEIEQLLKTLGDDCCLEASERDKLIRDKRTELRSARKSYDQFLDNVRNVDIGFYNLKAQAELFNDQHQYEREVSARTDLLSHHELKYDEAALQWYMLAMAYFNLGISDKAREAAETLRDKYPQSSFATSISSFHSIIPR